MNEKAEREKQRQHELQMQREWLEAQKALQQQAAQSTQAQTSTNPARDGEVGNFVLNLMCNSSLPTLRESSTTLGYFNGRLWAEMNYPQRLFYVEGLNDMLNTTHPPAFEGYSCNCTIGEFVNGITEFYNSDVAFQSLPITFAMLLYAQRAKGESPDHVAARARGYLKYLAAAQTAQKQ